MNKMPFPVQGSKLVLDDIASDVGRHRFTQFEAAAAPHRPAASRPGMAQWIGLARWHAPSVAGIAVACVVIALIATLVIPPSYRGTAVLLIDPRQPKVTQSDTVMPGFGADAAAVETQVDIISSSAVAGRVIDRLRLNDDPVFTAPSLGERLSGIASAVLGRDTRVEDDVRASQLAQKLAAILSVRRRGMTYAIEISAIDSNPRRAAEIANAVAQAYLDEQRAAKTEVASQASGWLDDRIDELRNRARDAEQAVADYKSAHDLVSVTQGNRLVSREIEDQTQQLALARARTAEARARLDKVRASAKRGDDYAELGEVLQSQMVANLRAQYAAAVQTEAGYRAIYGERNPILAAASRQVAAARQQIDREVNRIIAGVSNEFDVARKREAELESELGRLKSKSSNLGQVEVELGQLEREAQASRALYEQYLARAKDINEQKSLQIAEARIVSPAMTPTRPTRPGTAMLMIAAAVGGLLLGAIAVIGRESLRRGIRTEGELEEALGLRSWGVVAALPGRRRRNLRQLAASGDFDGATLLRNIRTRLRKPDRDDGAVLSLVAATPGEGTSTVAASVAAQAAAAGLRTLLIDADFIAGTVTRDFAVAGPGLLEVIERSAPVTVAIRTLSDSSLRVLGNRDPARAGRAPEAVRPGLSDMLATCRKMFDLVVIDVPALAAQDLAPEFLEAADAALLVVQWNKTPRQKLEAIVCERGSVPQHTFAGAVLTAMPARWQAIARSF
jgi:uncharacterized protein involved in exopolysaccharide biosynthesis/Mrp family chromosome partitioning ATPase